MPKVNTEDILGKEVGASSISEDYHIGKVLGKGAFGTVRVVTRKDKPDKRLAVKSISKSKLLCKEDVQDVQREVAIMNHVAGHPNVVNSKANYEDKHYVHIVMELCEGGELFDSIVSSGSFSEKKAAGVFHKMVAMLHHCHELGVMHRDLKPENFLLTSKEESAEIKVTDFGLSMFFKPEERFNELVGSPYYVAPEVLRKNYSYEADLWSLGVILYILLSGLPPFWGDKEEQIFKMVLRGKVDFDTQPWPKISSAAKDLVSQLLTMDPKQRPTCSAILQHPWLRQEGHGKDEPLDNVVLKRMKKFAAMNKLKKSALMVVGGCLSADEIQGMKRLFRTIDADSSGTITVKELQDAIKQWGHKIPEEEVMAIMSAADVDGDGFIDYNEFVAATMNMNQLDKEDLIYKAFQELDEDGSGTVSVEELEKSLVKFGIHDDTQELLKVADRNGDGQIDFQEFVLLMRETNKELRETGATGSILRSKLPMPGDAVGGARTFQPNF